MLLRQSSLPGLTHLLGVGVERLAQPLALGLELVDLRVRRLDLSLQRSLLLGRFRRRGVPLRLSFVQSFLCGAQLGAERVQLFLQLGGVCGPRGLRLRQGGLLLFQGRLQLLDLGIARSDGELPIAKDFLRFHFPGLQLGEELVALFFFPLLPRPLLVGAVKILAQNGDGGFGVVQGTLVLLLSSGQFGTQSVVLGY